MLQYLSYLAIVAAFAFVTLSLASGLLYVSELIEEHSRLAKVFGKRGIYAIIALHVLLYFTDNMPFSQTAFSVVCHIVYLQNFSSTWPLINLTSPSFIASCILVVADHFVWFFHFARVTSEARKLRTYRTVISEPPGFTEIASFFGLCVWLTPLFLFLSLSANDNAIPLTSTERPGSPQTFSSQQRQKPSRVSLVRSMLAFVSFDVFPQIRRKSVSPEGIIAPRSPMPPPRPLSPLPGISGSPRPNYLALPKSPMLRGQEIEVRGPNSANQNVRLNTPPPRRSTDYQKPIASRDALGLGIRRTASHSYDDM